ncbi:acyltransferase [Oceanobacillus piezotolerans]|uniref:Acyltransferase n=1 Tax=Oceanobacillus piezotolerans TaxID=2448030 RepID=A0A498D8Z7_9BACI|nr:acyltransferase [Oceanobacillus piezotolerans]RLL42766.1 acyltransferase [Oceanobacillus piezotolerans]
MFNVLKKIWNTIQSQSKERGIYITFLMNLSHVIGIIRAIFYKLLYVKGMKSSIFSLQANSRIEIFNKKSKVRIGKFVYIRKNASIRIDFSGQLDIEDYVFINDNCNINCVNRIRIGKHTKIAPNVCINDHDHNYKGEDRDHLLRGEVIIGENVWIGANVVILRDTVIGDNSIVAAGSVVKGDIPSNTLYMNKRENKFVHYPAKVMRDTV